MTHMSDSVTSTHSVLWLQKLPRLQKLPWLQKLPRPVESANVEDFFSAANNKIKAQSDDIHWPQATLVFVSVLKAAEGALASSLVQP